MINSMRFHTRKHNYRLRAVGHNRKGAGREACRGLLVIIWLLLFQEGVFRDIAIYSASAIPGEGVFRDFAIYSAFAIPRKDVLRDIRIYLSSAIPGEGIFRDIEMYSCRTWHHTRELTGQRPGEFYTRIQARH